MYNTVTYKIIELEVLSEITEWALLNSDSGADLIYNFGGREVWVVVPENLFDNFLSRWGNYISPY